MTNEMAKADVHQHRMRSWPRRWRCLLLRLALGRHTFDYMLRSIKRDPRTPGARLVDIVIRQDAREVRVEADWVKAIAKMAYHIPSPEIGRVPNFWRYVWCIVTLFHFDPCVTPDNRCKRCGCKVEVSPW